MVSSTINSPVPLGVPVGHVVLDDPNQVRALRIKVAPGAGRLDDPVLTGATDRRVHQDRGVSPVGQNPHDRQAQLG